MADELNVSLIFRAIDRATAPIRKITNNFEHMRKGWARAQKQFKRAAEMRQAATGVATFASKLRGILVAPITAFEEFEAAIAELRGVSQLSADAMARLEAEALRLGKTIGEFDPTGAAKGMTELARASFTEAEIMEALPHFLDLSTASTMELAPTIKTLTDVMGGYGMTAEDTQHASDVMTAAANASKTTFEGLAETMSYAGPILKRAGFTFEEAATAAGLLANASLGASRGGTTLMAVMARLTGAARGPGAKILKEMEIPLTRMVDGVEKFRTLPSLIADINKEMEGLPLEERLGQFGRIFGQQGATGAAALADALDGIGLEKLDAAMAATGGRTRQMAGDFRKTGKNETQQLTSAINTLNISLGDEMKEQTSAVKNSVKSLVESIMEWTQAHPKLTKVILITAGAVAILATILAGLMFTAVGLTTALGVMAIAFGSNKTGAQVLGGAIRGLVVRMKALGVVIWTRVLPAIWAWVIQIWTSMIGTLAAWAVTIWTVAVPAMLGWISTLWASVPAAIAAAAPFLAVAVAIGAITLAIVQLIKHWEELDFAEAMKGIAESVGEVGFVSTVGELFDPRTLLRDMGIIGPGAPVPAAAPVGAAGEGGKVEMVVELAEGLKAGRTEATGGVSVETNAYTGFLMQGVEG